MHKLAVPLLIALANSVSFYGAAAAGPLSTCLQDKKDQAESSIAACTAFLDSGEGSNGAKSQAHISRGNHYFNKGFYDEALKDYNNALELIPGNPVALYDRGNLETNLGQYDKAINDYTQAIARSNNQYAKAYNNRCFAYNGRGRAATGIFKGDPEGEAIADYDKAARDCRRAIELDPEQPEFYVGLGNALSYKGDFGNASENYNSATKLAPNYLNAFLGLCNVAIRTDDLSRAVKDCSDAIRLNDRDPIALNNRCWARTMIGTELNEALSDCNKALQLQPNDPYTLDSRGLTYLKLGRYNEAIADYDKALSFQPNRASSLFGRGLAKQRNGDASSGKQDIDSATLTDSRIVDKFRSYGVPYNVD